VQQNINDGRHTTGRVMITYDKLAVCMIWIHSIINKSNTIDTLKLVLTHRRIKRMKPAQNVHVTC